MNTWDPKCGSRQAWERLSSSWGLGGGRVDSSPRQSREHSLVSSKGFALSWRQRYASRRLAVRQRESRSTTLGLLALLLLLTFPTSCCWQDPTPALRPLLPVGRPAPASDALSKKHLAGWKPGLNNLYTIPKRELVNVLLNAGQWKAYALALEAAGDWR